MKSAHKKRALVALPAILAAVLAASLGGAAPAAGATDPIPEFDFSDCPEMPDGSDPAGSFCFNAVVTSGSYVLGDLSGEITEPIALTYASFEDADTHENSTVFGTLRGDEFKVRDGIFHDPITDVWAKMRYAGKFETPPSADFEIHLDAKVRLTQPFLLGPHCEIGKENRPHPLQLRLTTGSTDPPPPNTPISGTPAKLVEFRPPVVIRSATHVDNTFAVPGARGCALDAGLVNAIVNSQAGLPSEAGHNTLIMNEYIGSVRYSDLGDVQ